MNALITLKQAEIFDGLTDAQIALIAEISEERAYSSGDIIIEEGTPGTGLYLIESGMVRVQLDPSLVSDHTVEEKIHLATLRHGQSFGEISLVDEGMRSASVVAAQYDTRVMFIPRETLMTLCEANPQLGYRLMRNLAADIAMKIRNTDLKIRDRLYYATSNGEPGTE